jgi:hypothetical protein
MKQNVSYFSFHPSNNQKRCVDASNGHHYSPVYWRGTYEGWYNQLFSFDGSCQIRDYIGRYLEPDDKK